MHDGMVAQKQNHKSCKWLRKFLKFIRISSFFFSISISLLRTCLLARTESTLKFCGQNKCQRWRYKFVIINSAQLIFHRMPLAVAFCNENCISGLLSKLENIFFVRWDCLTERKLRKLK